MNKRFINISILLVAMIIVGSVSLIAKEPTDTKKSSLRKIAGDPRATLSNVNNISYWVRADGFSGRNPITGNPGVIFPRGTAGAIFADGILWGGLVNDGQSPRLRVGGAVYISGTLEGAILGERTGIAEDPTSSDVRIWRIREDWATADLTQDAKELFDIDADSMVSDAQISEIRAQYQTDWNEWPSDKGAPYYDDNGDGVYDPIKDRPGLANADQVVWFVANDLSAGATKGLLGSPPIGLEYQVTMWAYESEARLGNIIFRRNRLIYKGTDSTSVDATIDSMYISQWSDPDLGSLGDDFVGVDTLLNTGYVYNSTDVDTKFLEFGLAPPSVGYTLIQGPIVASMGDEAVQDFRIKSDRKNLPLSSFPSFPPPCNVCDGVFGSYEGTRQYYNLMLGLQATTGEPFIDPLTNETTVFTLAGDPVAGTGWVDGNPLGPVDRRMMMSSGPFTMVLGDTQEVIIAFVAGMGGSRLESIVEMKKTARLAISLGQNMFNEIPDANLGLSHPTASEAMMNLTVNVNDIVNEVIVKIFNYDDILEETLILLDDGSSGDGADGDNIWGIEKLVIQKSYGMYANALIISGPDTTRWDHIIDNITTLGPIEWSDLIIVSDNINEDGIINAGEKIVFSPAIKNGSVLNIGPAAIGTFLFDEYIILQNTTKMTEIDEILPGVTVLGDTLSRYFLLADDTPDGHLLNIRFSIVDRQNNLWVSELEVPVRELSFNNEIKSVDHVEGTASGTVGYRIADPSALTEEIYEVTVNKVESVFSFNLENLSTSIFLLQSEPFPDDEFSSTVPITEGFKVVFEDFIFNPPKSYKSAEQTTAGDSTFFGLEFWGDGRLFGNPTGLWFEFFDPGEGPPVPTINAMQVDLEFRFTGVDGGDNDSPVTSGGSFSTQWEQAAFGEPDLSVFANVQLRIPFELWDLEGNDGAGRQIEVAVINRNADGAAPYGDVVGTAATARYRMAGRDYIIVLNKDYTDDPNQVRSLNDLSATWLLFFNQSGTSVWATGDKLTLRYVNPIQAGLDVFRFQAAVGVDEENGQPKTFELSQNYPNPFNPETTINYSLPEQSDVKLLIYNLLGQEVYRFELSGQAAGEHQFTWNGRNQRGNQLSSGIYIYKYSAGDFRRTKKMLLLK